MGNWVDVLGSLRPYKHLTGALSRILNSRRPGLDFGASKVGTRDEIAHKQKVECLSRKGSTRGT